MNRIRVPLVLAFTFAGCALALVMDVAGSSGAAVSASRAATVRLEQTGLGEILVDGSGHTLYLFTKRPHDKDSCAKVAGCLETWPALTTTRRPRRRRACKSLAARHDQAPRPRRQVTYAGHPLYTYALDFVRRSTFNIGADEYGGAWYAVNAAGEAVD